MRKLLNFSGRFLSEHVEVNVDGNTLGFLAKSVYKQSELSKITLMNKSIKK